MNLFNRKTLKRHIKPAPVPATKAEAQIDSIVYALFDLTSDEIALLESVV